VLASASFSFVVIAPLFLYICPMKIWEIFSDALIESRLFEMAFERKKIRRDISALQPQINRHAVKIIVWSDDQAVSHWRRELTGWGNDLMGMQPAWTRQPMGVKMPWKHLYLEPFEGNEVQHFDLILRMLKDEGYTRPVTKTIPQIMAEYNAFIRPFCEAIGSRQTVGDIVNALGAAQPTAPAMEAAAAK
jgi:hypothetical protein